MSNLPIVIKPYYVDPVNFKYFREILEYNKPYKIKFSVDLNKLSEFEKTLNAFRLALEHYIENELLTKNITDKSLYNKLLTEFNEISIYHGYKPFYKISSSQNKDQNIDQLNLKRFPSPYFKGHSKYGNNFYPVTNYLPLNNWVTPRYHRPRLYFQNPVTVYPVTREWPYWSPAPPPPTLNIISPQTPITLSTQPLPNNNPTNPNNNPTNPNNNPTNQNINDLTIDPIRSGNVFRLNNKMVHLTYSYQPDLPTLLNYLNTIISNNKIITYSLVHENGNHRPLNQPHPHTHVALEFQKALQTKRQNFFDYNCPINPSTNTSHIHPHIRPVKYKKHWNTICNKYHKKEGIPLTNYVPLFDKNKELKHYDIHEAISIYKQLGENGIAEYINRIRPNDISRMDSICRTVKKFIHNENEENKKSNHNDSSFELNLWHKHIINFEIPNNGDRILIWVYDVVGNEQKTSFANYMRHNEDAIVITVTSSKNALCQLADENDNRMGVPIKTVIFDIPRSTKNMEDLYETIEMVKNGTFTSEKYKSREIDLGCKPVVLVLSNTYPKIKNCSIDRWKILTLGDGQIQHIFTDDQERRKHAKALEIINELESKNITNNKMSSYNDPYHMWPIETFPAGKQYINIIQEIIDSYRVPEIKLEYRPLTSKEILERRIMIKSHSEIRTKLFKDVDVSIIPFAEITFRCIYSRELSKGYVWDVSEISARDMTIEEKANHETNKKRIQSKKREYYDRELEKFENNYRNFLTSR